MGYRWKPNAAQRREYAAKCRERDAIAQTERLGAHSAIRVGCCVKYYSLNKGEIIEGTVITYSIWQVGDYEQNKINEGR